MSNLYHRKPQIIENTSLSENEFDSSDKTKSDPSIIYIKKKHWLILVVLQAIIFYTCYYFDSVLPHPLLPAEAGDKKFSEIRARQYLFEMASYGPKPSGSYAAEVLTRNFIVNQLEKLKSQNNKDAHMLDVDVQKPSGCFNFNISGQTVVLCYKNVTNIVAVLRPKVKLSDFSILVNCHFDSVPSSPGATDDLASCSIMLELVNILSKYEKSFDYNVIFLFNGAEENYMHGSHGFITQHKLRHSVKAVVNLEGAGAGGREVLFQSGPANMWMVHAYLNNAPYPHGNVMAQDIFDSGVSLSFTDYQIFRDFGRLSGLDIAYVKNGYLYHTEFDKVEYIPLGSLQRCGDNIFATILSMMQSPCVSKPCPTLEHQIIFFDILGLFIISYPVSYANIFHVVICGLILWKIVNQFRLEKVNNCGLIKENRLNTGQYIFATYGYTMGSFLGILLCYLLCFVSMAVTLFVMTRIVHFTNLTMCWYSRPLLILPLYILPFVTVGILVQVYLPKALTFLQLSGNKMEQLSSDVALSILGSVLMVLTYYGLKCSYFPFVLTVLLFLRQCLIEASLKIFGSKNLLFICHIITFIPASIFASYCFLELLTFFVPLAGRSGPTTNPELIISAICGLFSLPFLLFNGSLVHISIGIRYLLKCSIAIALFVIFIISVSSYGAPFTFTIESPHWRKLHIQHVQRSIELENGTTIDESGLWIYPTDYRGVQDLPQDTIFQGAKQPFCLEADVFCGLPYDRPRRNLTSHTAWVPLPETSLGHPISLQLLSKAELASNFFNFTFSTKGSDHLTLFVTPLNSWEITSWSFTTSSVNQQKTHFVYLATVNVETPWIFSILITHNKNNEEINENLPKLLIGVASHELHGEHQFSQSLKSVIKTVNQQRVEPALSKDHWKWAMTVDAWCSKYFAKYFV